ncbi:LEA type 2 family protein [Stenotrophomonas sp. STM01]|uniref:NDR1/HIN1-like protein n=1 Tax=Stenotrophomonas sp. STM01 TaxID=2769278 RepID=UPI00177D430C|nr:LEA type 2 family protein [Stenotrophomonas sp. STM01]MBD9534625.1 LEA type 2 family protein [Stenotrophomonas sp. STM01]
MRFRPTYALITVAALALAACSGGPVKRVSEPAASIQQLTVGNDGNWDVELRLRNYSSMPMRFDAVSLAMKVGDEAAGTLSTQPGVSIGPESADVVKVRLQPSSAARIVVADSLAGGRSLFYELEGTISATPEEKKQRSFDIKSRNSLNQAPGLPGVLR